MLLYKKYKHFHSITLLFKFQLLQVVERLCNLKPIEMKDDGDAEFELEMSLKDPTSKIFLFKVRLFLLNVYFLSTQTL